MRRIISAFALLTTAAMPAYAADLPARSTYAPAPIAEPAMSWSGFYVGGNVGYGWANASSGGAGVDLNGVIGGGQAGYNWQSGNLVLGIEGDFQGTGQNNTQTLALAGIGFTVKQEVPWLATLRGRVGYANGPWLIYGTGGAAWGDYKMTVTALGLTASSDASNTAWTAGGGVEWMFMPRWSVKAEYLYVDTGNTNVTLFTVPLNGRIKDNIARVGFNYHF